MNKINYTGKWALSIRNIPKAEWEKLNSILGSMGVVVSDKKYNPTAKYLYPATSQDMLIRGVCVGQKTVVTVLEMLNLLETPVKSATQLKIEELQQTIKLASDQIEVLNQPF